MRTSVDIRDLPLKLSELIEQASGGTEVIITDGNVAKVRLMPLNAVARRAGLHVGAIQTSTDFDAPLSDDYWQPELSDAMRHELDRRLDSLESDPNRVMTWEQVEDYRHSKNL